MCAFEIAVFENSRLYYPLLPLQATLRGGGVQPRPPQRLPHTALGVKG